MFDSLVVMLEVDSQYVSDVVGVSMSDWKIMFDFVKHKHNKFKIKTMPVTNEHDYARYAR